MPLRSVVFKRGLSEPREQTELVLLTVGRQEVNIFLNVCLRETELSVEFPYRPNGNVVILQF